MARVYGSLGQVYSRRGDLDKAEEMYRISLEEAQRVGEKETTAHQWANLGHIARQRGQLDEARSYWTQAEMLFGQMGMSKHQDDCTNALAQIASGSFD